MYTSKDLTWFKAQLARLGIYILCVFLVSEKARFQARKSRKKARPTFSNSGPGFFNRWANLGPGLWASAYAHSTSSSITGEVTLESNRWLQRQQQHECIHLSKFLSHVQTKSSTNPAKMHRNYFFFFKKKADTGERWNLKLSFENLPLGSHGNIGNSARQHINHKLISLRHNAIRINSTNKGHIKTFSHFQAAEEFVIYLICRLKLNRT